MAKKTKPWYKSRTTWGCIALFIAGGLEAIGATGALAVVEQLAAVVGLPLVGIGLRYKKD